MKLEKNKIKLLVLTIVIVLIAISVLVILFYPSPANVKIVSVNWNETLGQSQTGIIENDYEFIIEIKNIGNEGSNYIVYLNQYRVDAEVDGHLDATDSINGYLAGGDTTTVTLHTSVIADYSMFDIELQIYSKGYTDSWNKRIIQ